MNAMIKDLPPDDLRQELHGLAERLPEGATWADVLEFARFRAAVDAGIAAADGGEFASDQDVHQEFAKWGVEIESWVDPARAGGLRERPKVHRGRESAGGHGDRAAHQVSVLKLVQFPYIGRPGDDLKTREWRVQRTPNLPMHRLSGEVIEIVRVWHDKRDPQLMR